MSKYNFDSMLRFMNIGKLDSIEFLTKKYREASLLYHPDKNNSIDSGEKFSILSHHYSLLFKFSKGSEISDKDIKDFRISLSESSELTKKIILNFIKKNSIDNFNKIEEISRIKENAYNYLNELCSAYLLESNLIESEVNSIRKSILSGNILSKDNKNSVRKIVDCKFFKPYESKYDFHQSVLKLLTESCCALLMMNYPLVAVTYATYAEGPAAMLMFGLGFGLKGLFELLKSDQNKSQKSFEDSSMFITHAAQSIAFVTINPFFDLVGLITRSAVTLVDIYKNHQTTSTETCFEYNDTNPSGFLTM